MTDLRITCVSLLAIALVALVCVHPPYVVRNPRDAMQTVENHGRCAGVRGKIEALWYMATHRDRYPCSVMVESWFRPVTQAELDEIGFEWEL